MESNPTSSAFTRASRHSLSSLQLTPRVRELSSHLPSPTDSPRCVFVRIERQETVPTSTTAPPPPYALPIDSKQFDRATRIQVTSFARPHMRIFYLSWLSAITGFFGWYAIPPLMPVIKSQLELTDSQVLNSDIASTTSTIFSRILAGPLLDRYGPQVIQSVVLWLGAIPILAAAFVTSATSLLLVRFFIGLVGCVFVTSQYWTSITFARNVVGSANAITGGLGLAGIGFAFLLLPFVFQVLSMGAHVSQDVAWRLTIALPAVLMLVMGLVIRFAVDGCPTGEFHDLVTKKNRQEQAKPSSFYQSFRIVLSDSNVLIMILHYGASFGTELQLNNMGALYFYTKFTTPNCLESSSCSRFSKTSAATIASSFGLMNLFARALGGLLSDSVNRRFGMRGRQYCQLMLLCLLGALVLGLSQSESIGPCVTLYVLIAIAAQAAGGAAYGIVPSLNEQHIGTVNGLVGAGGNLGGALFGVLFRTTGSYQTGLLYMSIAIFISAFFTPLLRLSHLNHQSEDMEDPSTLDPSDVTTFKSSSEATEKQL